MRSKAWMAGFAAGLLGFAVPGHIVADLKLHVTTGRGPAQSSGIGVAEVFVSDEPAPYVEDQDRCFTPAALADFGVIGGFDTDSAEPPPGSGQWIASLVAVVQQSPCLVDRDGSVCPSGDAVYDVTGHADERDSSRPGGNLALSFERAERVASALVTGGVAAGTVRGRADLDPSPSPVPDQRSDEKRWSDDRRVVIVPRC